MVELTRVWICKPLIEVFEDIRKNVAEDLKKKYNLEEITIPNYLSSQILAAKYKGIKILNFKVKKISLNKGILELV